MIERLRERVTHYSIPEPNTGCWLWLGPQHKLGYGFFFVQRKYWLAHRASWVAHKGPIPRELCVCHRCDVRSCVNPDHLWLGSKADNNLDRDEKKRGCVGERKFNAKLTDDAIRSIRVDPRGCWKLAREYNVARETIKKVRRGEIWRHVH